MLFLILMVLIPETIPCEEIPFEEMLSLMKARFASIDGYQCVYDSYSALGEKELELIFSYQFKKPKKIRMEIIAGAYSKTVLIYDPERKKDQVRVRAGNEVIAYLQKLLYGEYLNVDDDWVTDMRGNGIHQSDWSWFIEQHMQFVHFTKTESVRKVDLNGRPALYYILVSDAPEKTLDIAKEEIWVDCRTAFPVKLIQYDSFGRMTRRSFYNDIRLDVKLPNKLFMDL